MSSICNQNTVYHPNVNRLNLLIPEVHEILI